LSPSILLANITPRGRLPKYPVQDVCEPQGLNKPWALDIATTETIYSVAGDEVRLNVAKSAQTWDKRRSSVALVRAKSRRGGTVELNQRDKLDFKLTVFAVWH